MHSPIINALWLLKRQNELETALRKMGDIPLAQHQELMAIRSRLSCYPAALEVIADAAQTLHRPINSLSADDVVLR